MKGNLYIDGNNAYSKYGVWVVKGGYNDLFTFPALQEPPRNDWPDEDGVEVDLSAPRLQSREIRLNLLSSGSNKDLNGLFTLLLSGGYHNFSFPTLGRNWNLRLVGEESSVHWSSVSELSLRLAEDVPANRAGVASPGIYVPLSTYKLDGTPFSAYGIVVDRGRDELLKSPAVKQNLTRKISTIDGQLYDTISVYLNNKEITFKCRLKAASMSQFWNCYDAFFSAWISPGEHDLYAGFNGKTYPCHYKNTSGWRLIKLSGYAMLEFNLTLVITKDV